LKNTDTVLEAWRANPDLPPLTVISEKQIMDPPPNVTALERQPFTELKRHINQHRIHVCPSRVEGWGHYITEGLSAGASVITTDASPMNEHVDRDWAWLLPPSNQVRRHLVHEYDVSPAMIASAVREASALTADQQARMSGSARASVAARNEKFKETAFDLLERLK
jgi:glycosyltransferase involved in cell wall biosynthesis